MVAKVQYGTSQRVGQWPPYQAGLRFEVWSSTRGEMNMLHGETMPQKCSKFVHFLFNFPSVLSLSYILIGVDTFPNLARLLLCKIWYDHFLMHHEQQFQLNLWICECKFISPVKGTTIIGQQRIYSVFSGSIGMTSSPGTFMTIRKWLESFSALWESRSVKVEISHSLPKAVLQI